VRAAEPFRFDNGLMTANARLRRDAVWARYAQALRGLYRARHDSAAGFSSESNRSSMQEIG
jgi:hypothetical protein